MEMKSLVFSHVALWPAHHAETVEIALNEYNAGNEVVFLSCTGALATCPANPLKKEPLCKSCRKQTEYTKSKSSVINSNQLKFEYYDVIIGCSDNVIKFKKIGKIFKNPLIIDVGKGVFSKFDLISKLIGIIKHSH